MKDFSVNQSLIQRALLQVRQGIIREYGEVPRERVKPLYDPLFSELNTVIGRRCLPIFTTNYDPAIEQYCELNPAVNLVRGFGTHPLSERRVWSRAIFDDYNPPPDKRGMVLFKLHGSADWATENASKEITLTPPVHHTDPRFDNTVIYPAMRKVAIDEPYSTAYDYFQRCCEHARMCIAIDYSFRDYDALTRLRSAARLNPDLTVLLISPQATELSSKVLAGVQREPIDVKFDVSHAYLRDLERELLPLSVPARGPAT
jgi:hypothetical protein